MAKVEVDFEKYRKSVKEGVTQRTYIAYKAGTPGFEAVAMLRSRGLNVEAIVEDFLTQAVSQKR